MIPATIDGVPLSQINDPRIPTDAAEMRGMPYRGAVGAPMWIFTMNRTGIVAIVGTVATF